MTEYEKLEEMIEKTKDSSKTSFVQRLKQGIISWFDRPIKTLDVLIFTVVAIGIALVVGMNERKSIVIDSTVKAVEVKLPIKESEVIESKFVFDLEEYEVTKVVLKELKDKDGENTGVKNFRAYYRNVSDLSSKKFLTIEESIKAIKINKVAYEKYLKDTK